MRECTSLIGERFGKLTVVGQLESDKSGNRKWLCRCECGGEHIATTGNLRSGRSTNCGCKKSPDLTGKVFGRLTVLGRSDKRNPRGSRTTPMWECRCECGAITYKATDTLKNKDESMCQACQGAYASQNARLSAGYVDGTQISRIINMKPTAANSTGVRGVQLDKKTGRYRARLKFKGKLLNFGSYKTLEEAAEARRAAELEYFGTFLEDIGRVE
ncbi:MAG: hypothetical protein IJZ03_02440 [Clostridia bacterium]|nr:hypothetical protein [Clostridia bacterium]